ncbi:putative cold shock protein CS66-like [Capsicum annuum]|nr:putative cold shock protein CS66-like [Capsicum annuum]
MSSLPSINQAYAMVISDESKKSIGATAGILGSTPTITGYESVMFMRNNDQNSYLKIRGHAKENCWKIIAYPTDFKFRKRRGTNTSANAVCNVGEKNAGHGHSQLVHSAYTQANYSNPTVNSGMGSSSSQTNVYNAFLQGDLHEEIYMDFPQGFKSQGEKKPVCRLLKSLSKKVILMHQRKYALELISKKRLGAAKPAATPIGTNIKLTTKEYDDHVYNYEQEVNDPPTNIQGYQRLLGKLLYLTMIRLDISYIVQTLRKSLQQPKKSHMDVVVRLVRHIKQKPRQRVLLSSQSNTEVTTYSDTDWASCLFSRRSVTGYFVKLGESMVSWKSKKKNTISRSSGEAEYKSIVTTIAELIWLIGLLKEIGVEVKQLAKIYTNSKSVMQIASNPIMNKLRKRNDNQIVSELPIDTIIEILHRLPSKSLVRFKCVSRSWALYVSDCRSKRLLWSRTIGFFYQAFRTHAQINFLFTSLGNDNNVDQCVNFLPGCRLYIIASTMGFLLCFLCLPVLFKGSKSGVAIDGVFYWLDLVRPQINVYDSVNMCFWSLESPDGLSHFHKRSIGVSSGILCYANMNQGLNVWHLKSSVRDKIARWNKKYTRLNVCKAVLTGLETLGPSNFGGYHNFDHDTVFHPAEPHSCYC